MPSRSVSPLRAPLASVSALLVVSLFLGASINAGRPATSMSGQDAAGQRVAVRQLSVSLARAVRHLVGSDHHKPCVQATTTGRPEGRSAVLGEPPADPSAMPRVALLRSALLDLPPPRA